MTASVRGEPGGLSPLRDLDGALQTPEVDLSAELAEARRRLDELESLVEISPVAIVVMDADERGRGRPADVGVLARRQAPVEARGELVVRGKTEPINVYAVRVDSLVPESV